MEWIMLEMDSPHPLASCTATARSDLFFGSSYVAPVLYTAPHQKHEKKLTYCPVYGFKLHAILTKDLTLALF